MRKILLLLFLCCYAAAADPPPKVETPSAQPPTDAAADDDTDDGEIAWQQSDDVRWLSVSAGFFKYDYQETLSAPLKSTENGILPELRVMVERLVDQSRFVRLTLHGTIANTQYVGTQIDGTPLTATTNDTLFGSELDFGLRLLPITDDISVSFYVGYALQYWNRQLSYDEEYSWMYAPLGLLFKWDLDDELRLDLDASLRFPFFGMITGHFSDLSSSYQDGQGLLGMGRTGVRLEIPFHYYPSDQKFSFVLTPWFEYSSFGNGSLFPLETTQGQVIDIAHEPRAGRINMARQSERNYRFDMHCDPNPVGHAGKFGV